MSVESRGIGLAKQIKKLLKKQIKALTPLHIYPVRRVNGVKTSERVCAMTFDDGPFNLPINKDGETLTMHLVETLERYGAKGTFDCIGDTSDNYPDVCGEEGTAMWGGIAYDHYPDFEKDNMAGIKNCPELVKRILSGGHEITSHTYAHRLFGPKPLVYKDRKYIGSFDGVVADLNKFHSLMQDGYGYTVKLSRPPHYVDNIDGTFNAYDAYEMLDYQYLGAGPDGAGWLPLSSYEEEVAVMEKNIAEPLKANPDAFCGSIIFQKDGYNMARRTPVADGLELQLKILKEYGYRVVTVSELLSFGQFEDLGPDDNGYEICKALLDRGLCPAFSDNCVHLERKITKEELAMVLFGHTAVRERIKDKAAKGSAYNYAMQIAKGNEVNLDAIMNGSSDRLTVYKNIFTQYRYFS